MVANCLQSLECPMLGFGPAIAGHAAHAGLLACANACVEADHAAIRAPWAPEHAQQLKRS